MSEDKKKEEVKKYTPEEFAAEYNKLVTKTGFRVLCVPVWIARDDGTFSMQLQYTVDMTPRKPVEEESIDAI